MSPAMKHLVVSVCSSRSRGEINAFKEHLRCAGKTTERVTGSNWMQKAQCRKEWKMLKDYTKVVETG